MMRSRDGGLLFAVCVSLFSCGSNNQASSDAGSVGDSTIGCANDPRAQIYTANMQQKGYGNLLTFVLAEGAPAPPVRGTNTWTVKLLDGAGNVVPGATIMATPYMPDHGHGTSVVPETTQSGDSYTITPLYLFMAGLWQVTLQAMTPAGDDSTVFNFCIPG
jgi:YtkA-like protein